MARGVNKVILIGNLGDEPTVRQTTTGKSVASISMVTNEVRRNAETGENTEYAEWHRVTMWNKLAEIAGQYLHKGSQVYIEGKLRTRSYDKDGQKHYVTEIIADEMQMLGSRQGGSAGASQSPRTDWNSKPASPYGNQNQQTANPYGTNNNSYGQQNSSANSYGSAPAQNPYGTPSPNVYGGQPAAAPANSYGQAAPMQNPYNPAPAPQAPQAQPSYAQPTAAPQPNPYTAQAAEPTEPAMTLNDDIPF